MIYKDNVVILKDGAKCLFPSPDEKDATVMLQYMKITSAETHYMIRYPEEIQLTEAKEAELLNRNYFDSGSIKMAEIIGYEQIELGVLDDNIKAQKLYRKFGFNE